MKTKTCTKCKETKQLSEFYKNRSKKGGVSQECIKCDNERSHRYYEANKDKIRDTVRRYREANKEKIAEYSRKYHKDNKKKLAESNRTWQSENKASIRRRQDRYFQEMNERSLELANRKWHPWEDWEEEFVLSDNGLTNYQKAVKLGRSFVSVKEKKYQL